MKSRPVYETKLRRAKNNTAIASGIESVTDDIVTVTVPNGTQIWAASVWRTDLNRHDCNMLRVKHGYMSCVLSSYRSIFFLCHTVRSLFCSICQHKRFIIHLPTYPSPYIRQPGYFRHSPTRLHFRHSEHPRQQATNHQCRRRKQQQVPGFQSPHPGVNHLWHPRRCLRLWSFA